MRKLFTHRTLAIFLCATMLLPMPMEQAVAEKTAEELARELQRATLAPRHQISQNKRLSTNRYRTRNFRHYESSSGTPTLTNIPHKYKQSSGYKPVQSGFRRVNVPTNLDHKSLNSYTTSNVAALITRYARMWGLDENLVYAVIRRESNFNPNAVSRAGACGLMQLMPGTAAELGVTNIFSPAQNIAGGTQYLSRQLKHFDGNLQYALAAYNAGPKNVEKYNGIPPFQETKNYVKKVLEEYSKFKTGGPSLKSAALKGKFGKHVKFEAPAWEEPVQGEFVVHFHSGLTQVADNVIDKDPYYYIEYRKNSYAIRKELISRIEKPA